MPKIFAERREPRDSARYMLGAASDSHDRPLLLPPPPFDLSAFLTIDFLS